MYLCVGAWWQLQRCLNTVMIFWFLAVTFLRRCGNCQRALSKPHPKYEFTRYYVSSSFRHNVPLSSISGVYCSFLVVDSYLCWNIFNCLSKQFSSIVCAVYRKMCKPSKSIHHKNRLHEQCMYTKTNYKQRQSSKQTSWVGNSPVPRLLCRRGGMIVSSSDPTHAYREVWWHPADSLSFIKFVSCCMHRWEPITNLRTIN